MSKQGLVLVLAALAGCKYGALPSLQGHDDAPPGVVDAKADGPKADATPPPDGMPPDGPPDAAPPDAPPDAAICAATSACIEAPTPGWTGPAIFYEGDFNAMPPACAGDYPTTAVTLDGGLDGGNATCSCTCGTATGTSCGNATLGASNAMGCLTANGNQTLAPGNCASLNIGGHPYYNLSVPDVTGGSCAPSLAKTLPPPTWSTQFRACTGSGAFTSAGCSANQVCAPRPAAPFDSQICIYASGAVSCPSGSAYSNRRVRYASYSDTRDCSSCTCDTPMGSCGGAATFTEGPTTSGCGNILDGAVTRGCHAFSTGGAVHVIYNPDPHPTCTPTTSTVTGMLSGTQPTTFCCLTP